MCVLFNSVSYAELAELTYFTTELCTQEQCSAQISFDDQGGKINIDGHVEFLFDTNGKMLLNDGAISMEGDGSITFGANGYIKLGDNGDIIFTPLTSIKIVNQA